MPDDLVSRIVRDGNGNTLVYTVAVLQRDVAWILEWIKKREQKADRWQDRVWGLVTIFVAGILTGCLLPLLLQWFRR